MTTAAQRLPSVRPTSHEDGRQHWFRHEPSGVAAALAIFIIFGLIVPLIVLSDYPLSRRTLLVQTLQIGLTLYASLRLATIVALGQPRWMSFTLWVFVYTVFCIPQIVQLSLARNPLNVYVNDSLAARQLVIVIIGCICVDIGVVTNGRRNNASAEREVAQQRVFHDKRVIGYSIFTVAVSPIIVAKVGGLAALFTSRESVADALGGLSLAKSNASSALLLGLGNVLPLVALVTMVQLRRARRLTWRGDPWFHTLLLLVVVVNIVLNNPISQPRFWIATLSFAIIFAWSKMRGSVPIAILLAGVLLVSTVLFAHLDAFRSNKSDTPPSQISGIAGYYAEKTDYASNIDVMNTVVYVDQHGETNGRQMLGAVLFWVPRSLWPGKPRDTGYILAKNINFPNLNLDCPLWGEAYINFGIPGVIIVMTAYGLLIGFLERRLMELRTLGSATWASVALPVLAGYQLIFLRGSLLQSMGRLSLLLVLLGFLTTGAAPGMRVQESEPTDDSETARSLRTG